jgi:hypothetical protein
VSETRANGGLIVRATRSEAVVRELQELLA